MKQVALIAAIFFISCVQPVFASPLKYDFIVSSCGGDPWMDYIEEAQWKGNDLNVGVVASYNCSYKELLKEAKVEGDLIFIKVDEKLGESYAKCDCNYHLNFTFHDLPKKTYRIQFYSPKEELTLTPDNKVSDYCDARPDFQCYVSRGKALGVQEKEKTASLNEIKFSFANKDIEAVALKHPSYLNCFRRGSYKDRMADTSFDSYEIGFDDAKGLMKTTAFKKGVSGNVEYINDFKANNFEQALTACLNKVESPDVSQAAKTLQSKLGLPVMQLSENGFAMRFMYNNEEIEYSTTINFIDREFPSWSFFMVLDSSDFNGHLDRFSADDITQEKLLEYVDLADKAYNILKKDKNAILESHNYGYINPKTKMAKTTFNVNLVTGKIKIHNRDMDHWRFEEKDFYLSLDKGTLSQINPAKGK